MPRTIHLENQIAAAKNRLEAMEKAEAVAMDNIRTIINAVSEALKISDADRRYADDAIAEALADMTSDVRNEVEREISNAEQELDDIEYADLQRSSPVVL